MAKDVMIALDFPDKKTTLQFLDKFSGEKPYVKIGMELYYAEGPDIVREVKARGHQIFLDLKLHDIPNTVSGAARSLRSLGVDMMNLHALGGVAMMKAAADTLKDTAGVPPKLIAVTVLTSHSQETLSRELWVSRQMEETVLHYAGNAKAAGLDGVVCSPLEAGKVHERLGSGFLTVTPGVRFAAHDTGDQVRVTTPQLARELGADYIVVGRPITKAEDPVSAYRRCIHEFLDR